MLKHLHIQNYALISHLDINLDDGFSVLTGETGAGKSIILGALNLVMGGKADAKAITDGEQRCCIEATFDTEIEGKVQEIIIRRELNANGRSRSFINDEVVSQTELKLWASKLIDIHSQHENLLIENTDFQLNIVDAIALAKDSSLLTTYQQVYESYIRQKQVVEDLKAEAKKALEDADYIQFQFQQLQDAHLQTNEQDELESEQYRLSHAEDIKLSLQTAIQYLDGENAGALQSIHSIHIDQASSDLAERLRSVEIELEDILGEIQRQEEQTEADPARLQEVEERLQLISTLEKKHRVQSIDELIAIREKLQKQCQSLDNYDEDIRREEEKLQNITSQLDDAAKKLTQKRTLVGPDICNNLSVNLQHLGIQHAKVGLEITEAKDYTINGRNNVQFMFAANLNQTMRVVSDVASGGEISRFMLCVKSLIASTKGLPTIIFDEIDTGVSGEVATQMGRIMRDMAQSRQIIAITHLPQIAALGTTQYHVYKEDTTIRTETHIRQLTDDERIDEIAAMISGKQKSDTSRAMAVTLLNTNTQS